MLSGDLRLNGMICACESGVCPLAELFVEVRTPDGVQNDRACGTTSD